MSLANLRLLAGLIALPALLFQSNFLALLIQSAYIIILAVSHSRRFKLLPNLLLLFSVSLAHLLQPNGLHLFSIGRFPVTAGALLLGAHKAFTLISLLYLSQYMVTARPQFPGALGKLITLQFYYFERIREAWHIKRPLTEAIDEMLLELEVDPSKATKRETSKAPLREFLWNSIHIIVLWALFFIGHYSILPRLN
ncbi:MAG: hypothetical protein WC224_06450 [Sphaerochaetaceae bacterium]